MQGCFEILSLSGSYLTTNIDSGVLCRTGGLSISLSSTDGRVFGGSVGGMLIAASPIQVSHLTRHVVIYKLGATVVCIDHKECIPVELSSLNFQSFQLFLVAWLQRGPIRTNNH